MKKLLLALIPALLGLSGTAQAQSGFYDISRIQKIEITLTQSNWDYQMDTAKAGAEGFLLCDNVLINGVRFDSVGVKYKGNSSYRSTNVKNPLHIELDYIKGNQNYQGFSDVKLSNGFQDPSNIREVLAYEIARNYMTAPEANFARVYINGAYSGMYSSAESISKKFAESNFSSSGLPMVKCNPIGGAGPGSGSYPTLNYLGADSALYSSAYEIKSNYGWRDFISLTKNLDNTPATVAGILDVDRALWMHVFNNLLINLDSYLGSFAQNYYLLQDRNGRFNPIVWDLNMAFGSFTNSSTSNLNATTMKQLSPLDAATNANRPLISKLLAIPECKRKYIAHYNTMMKEQFVSGAYLTRAQSLLSLVDSSVKADNNKFYTYTQFQNSLTTTATGTGPGPGGNGTIGISQLMSARTTWLQTQATLTASAPTVADIVLSPLRPALNDAVNFNIKVTNGTTAQIGYRYNLLDKFSYAGMYDDGAHNDGVAGDGIFGTTVNMAGAQMQYYFYAENANAGIFSPERAEHEFYSITAATASVAPGSIKINEFLAVNQAGITDATGSHEDWIELYNTTNAPISLLGLYLTDDSATLNKWAFPATASIPANGYLFIWADSDGDTDTSGIHAGFKLGAGGEMIFLSDNAGTVIDSVIFGAQTPDQSMARCPDGSGSFVTGFINTPDQQNICETGIAEQVTQSRSLGVYPNPATDMVTIVAGKQTSVRLINNLGQTIMNVDIAAEGTTISLGILPKGFYTLVAPGMKPVRLVVE
ncbi:MAG: CotH kinase family protein [Bacteroidota bacterium]